MFCVIKLVLEVLALLAKNQIRGCIVGASCEDHAGNTLLRVVF